MIFATAVLVLLSATEAGAIRTINGVSTSSGAAVSQINTGFRNAAWDGYGFTSSVAGSFELNDATHGGQLLGFCMDRGLAFPPETVSFSHTDNDPRWEQMAYLLWAYSDSNDPVDHAAISIINHYASGNCGPCVGTNATAVTINNDASWEGFGPAVKTRVDELFRESNLFHGPYTVEVVLQDNLDGLNDGFHDGTVNAIVRVRSAANVVVPNVDVRLWDVANNINEIPLNSNNQALQIRTTDANGEIRFSITTPNPDRNINLRANILEGDSPATSVNIYNEGRSSQGVVTEDLAPETAFAGAVITPLLDPELGELTIRKIDADTGDAIGGMVIDLIYEGDIVENNFTVPVNGVTFSDIPIGVYTVVEVQAPPGYNLTTQSSANLTVNVQDGDQDEIVVENSLIPEDSSIRLNKINAITRNPIEGAVFNLLFDAPGLPVDYVPVAGATGFTVPAGGIVFDNLPAGDYRFEEVSAPDGFVLNPNFQSRRVDGTAEDNRTINFTNLPELTVETQVDNQVIEFGESVTDVMSINGIETNVRFEGTATVYGPFDAPPTSTSCVSSAIAFEEELTRVANSDANGSTVQTTTAFTPDLPGYYTYVVSINTGDGREATHPCGLPAESFLVNDPVPVDIDTEVTAAQITLDPRTGEVTIADQLATAGLDSDETLEVELSLHGPFSSELTIGEIATLCQSDQPVISSQTIIIDGDTDFEDLTDRLTVVTAEDGSEVLLLDGVPASAELVAAVNAGVTNQFTLTSDDFIVNEAGVYSFSYTASVTSDAEAVARTSSEDCGVPSETFEVLNPTPVDYRTQVESPLVVQDPTTGIVTMQDNVFVQGLTAGETADIILELHGPLTIPAGSNAVEVCAAGGTTIVDTQTVSVIGTDEDIVEALSEPFTVSEPGIYSFAETLAVTSDADNIDRGLSRTCGDTTETFQVDAPPPVEFATQVEEPLVVLDPVTGIATMQDNVFVQGLAEGETADIVLELHGPFAEGDDVVALCAAGGTAIVDTQVVSFTGTTENIVEVLSEEFTVNEPGIYSFAEALAVTSDAVNVDRSGSRTCGDTTETFQTDAPPPLDFATQVESPLVVQDPQTGTATIQDNVFVQGLLEGETADIILELHGPLTIPAGSTAAEVCAAGGTTIVDTQTVAVDGVAEGIAEALSEPFIVSEPGIYSFAETLVVTSDADNIDRGGSRLCGDVTETFQTDAPPPVEFATQVESPLVVQDPTTGAATIQDNVFVQGLAEGETADIVLELHGPFAEGDDVVALCAAGGTAIVDTQTVSVTGAGADITEALSENFSVFEPGIYSFAETLVVTSDADNIDRGGSRLCGDVTETFQTDAPPPVEFATQVAQGTIVQDPTTGAAAIQDNVFVQGLAAGETADIVLELHGPFAEGDDVVALCAAGGTTIVDTQTVSVTGAGADITEVLSEVFTVNEPGIYSFAEALVVTSDADNIDRNGSRPCGEITETFTAVGPTPVIFQTQVSQTVISQDSTSGEATIRDSVIVQGLDAGETAAVTLELHGPFGAGDDVPALCAAGDTTLVETQTVIVAGVEGGGPVDVLSGEFTVFEPGIYSFAEALVVTSDADNIDRNGSRPCGEISETFTTTSPNPVSFGTQVSTPVTAINPATSSAEISDTVSVTGLAEGEIASVLLQLRGPFASLEEVAALCSAGDNLPPVIGSTTVDIAGDDDPSSPDVGTSIPFLIEDEGIYSFGETLTISTDAANVADRGSSRFCGGEGETVVVNGAGTLAIGTQVSEQLIQIDQTQIAENGTVGFAPIFDTAFVTGLNEDETGEVTFTLFGPFESAETMATICSSGDTSSVARVGVDTVQISGSSNDVDQVESNLFQVTEAGLFSFAEALVVTSDADPTERAISNPCGVASETFTVEAPTEITFSTQVSNNAIAFTNGDAEITDTVTVNGLADGEAVEVALELFGPIDGTANVADVCAAGEAPSTGLVTTVNVVGGGSGVDTVTSNPIFLEQGFHFAGQYSFGENLTVLEDTSGVRNISRPCGDVNETFSLISMDTFAQTVNGEDGISVNTSDLVVIEGAPTGSEVSVTAELFRAESFAALSEAELVETTTANLTVSDDAAQLQTPETTVDRAGYYSYVVTADITLESGEVIRSTHDLGVESESFQLKDFVGTKFDTVTGEPVPGALYQIINEIGTLETAFLETDENGEVRWLLRTDGLNSVSAFCAVEIAAPPGYELDTEARCFPFDEVLSAGLVTTTDLPQVPITLDAAVESIDEIATVVPETVTPSIIPQVIETDDGVSQVVIPQVVDQNSGLIAVTGGIDPGSPVSLLFLGGLLLMVAAAGYQLFLWRGDKKAAAFVRAD